MILCAFSQHLLQSVVHFVPTSKRRTKVRAKEMEKEKMTKKVMVILADGCEDSEAAKIIDVIQRTYLV